MTHARKRTFIGTVLAVTCLAVLFTAGSDARDTPISESRRSQCQLNVTQEIIQQVPTGRNFEGLAGLLPERATLQFEFNARGKPTDAFLIDGQNRYDFGRIRFNERECSVRAEIPRTEFGNTGFTGRLELSWLTRPSERAHFKASRLNYQGGPVRGDRTFFFLPVTGQVGGQPPPGNIPMVTPFPMTPTPLTPDEAAPSQGFPIYSGGPFLLNGATANAQVFAVPHPNCDGHTVIKDGVTYRLCSAGEGETSLTAFNVTPRNFEFRKTSVPRMGWQWNPFACEPTPGGPVRCTAKGRFLDNDILGTISNLQVTPGTLNFGADLSVQLVATQADVLFRAKGRVVSLGF